MAASPSSAPAVPSSSPPASLFTERPPGAIHATLTMAALCGLGGVAGYAKAGSARSAAGGLLFAGGFSLAAYHIQGGEGERGFRLGTTVSVLLAGIMGWRATKRVMPAAPLAALGAASAVYHGMKWREWAGDE